MFQSKVQLLCTQYIQDNGEPETIPENPGIWHFVWEHFQDLNCVVQQMKYSGSTFSGYKSTLCAPEITVLGHHCTAEGRLPDSSRVAKIVNWGPCKDLTDVRTFVRTIWVCRLFIKNFAHQVHLGNLVLNSWQLWNTSSTCFLNLHCFIQSITGQMFQ